MEGAPEVTHPVEVALDLTKEIGAATGSSKVQPVYTIQYLVQYFGSNNGFFFFLHRMRQKSVSTTVVS